VPLLQQGTTYLYHAHPAFKSDLTASNVCKQQLTSLFIWLVADGGC
jgi:hypothetical protein